MKNNWCSLYFGLIGTFLLLSGCGSESLEEDTESSGITMPKIITQSRLVDTGTIAAYISVDGSARQQMTITGSSASHTFPNLLIGSHQFIITIEYTANADPNNSIPLAQIIRDVSVSEGSNPSLNVASSEYDYNVFDDDGDGLGNLYELLGNHVMTLTTGSTHSCALFDNGAVKCWGSNFSGQLGIGDTANRGDAANEMGDALANVDLGSGRTAVALAAGSSHSCALLDNGAVKCWGENFAGQLGIGDTANRGDAANEMGDALPVVDLGTGRTAVILTAGSSHSCALLDNGALKCWGDNTYGQLGLGDTVNRGDAANEMGDALPVVDLGTGRVVIALTAGQSHSCALLDNGEVKCWGDNFTGQLGLGDTNSRGDAANEMGDTLPTVDLGSGRMAVAISAGTEHSCALLDNGEVKCWGYNSYGQLGLGDIDDRGDAANGMGDALGAVDLGAGRTAVMLQAGSLHTCALLDNDAVKCWGYNSNGRLGLGDTEHRGDAPNELGDLLPEIDFGNGRTAVSLTVGARGARHNCARLDNGAIKCWGYNGNGQLGLGDMDNRGDGVGLMGDFLPEVDLDPAVNLISKPTAVTMGGYHSCALYDIGTVKCWGGNVAGALGLGDMEDRGDVPNEMGDNLPAVDLGTGRTAVALTAGFYHSCALLDNGVIKCWGSNNYGQLGLGDTSSRGDSPNEMGDFLPSVDLGTGRTAVALTSGSSHNCAILDNGTVKCWGWNASGGLGLGDSERRGDAANEMGDYLPAVNLGTGRTALAVTAGADHSCAILDNGAIKCWGWGGLGVLGLGDTTNRGDAANQMGDSLPTVNLGTGRTAVALATGNYHNCVLLDNGAVKCWGWNWSGHLGQGDRVDRGDNANEMGDFLPEVDLGSGRSALALVTGGDDCCVLLDNGEFKCWGANRYGQLGLGDTADRGDGAGEMGDALPAVDLGSGRTAVSLAASGSRSCALLDNNEVKCWGYNGSGGLGLGDMDNRGDDANEMGDFLPIVDLGTL